MDCSASKARSAPCAVTWHDLSGIPARVTYHPSYLLQSGGSNEVKRSLWEDMLSAMEKLGMPVSEKQKSYFLPKA